MNNVKNKYLRDKKHIDKEFNMNKLMQLTKDFINDEEGLTIVEYVLGAAALVIAVGTFFGDETTGFFATLKQALNGKVSSL